MADSIVAYQQGKSGSGGSSNPTVLNLSAYGAKGDTKIGTTLSTSSLGDVTFGTPVEVDLTNTASFNSGTLTVISGQPIGLLILDQDLGTPSIADTFSTPYTWTHVVSAVVSDRISLWIGTNGAGTSGQVTVTNTTQYQGGAFIPCIGASTVSGLGALDGGAGGTHASSGTTASSPSLTPSVSGDGAIYGLTTDLDSVSGGPSSPWTNTLIKLAGSAYGAYAIQSSPTSGTSLSTSWTCANGGYESVAMLVLPATSAVVTDLNASFTSGDVGKVFAISGSPGVAVPFVTTIASVQSSTQITLTSPPTSSWSANGYYAYGTDDTAAFQSAINAAVSLFYASNYPRPNGGKGVCTIQLESSGYMIAGPLVTSSNYNSQIQLPTTASPPTGSFFQLSILGRGVIGPYFINGGTFILSTLINPGFSTSTGIPSCIGGPASATTSGQTGSSSTGIYCSGISFMQLEGGGGFLIDAGLMFGTGGVENCSFSTVFPWQDVYDNQHDDTQGHVVCPASGTLGPFFLNKNTFIGTCTSVVMGGFLQGNDNTFFYCVNVFGLITTSTAWPAGVLLGEVNITACQNYIAGTDFAHQYTAPVVESVISIVTLALEERPGGDPWTPVSSVYDPSNYLFGEFKSFTRVISSVGFEAGITAPNGAEFFRMYDDLIAPGAFTVSIPATTVNSSVVYRDQTLIVTGGVVTAIVVDGITTGLITGTVVVPAGKLWSITYSSIPTVKGWYN